MAHTFFMPQGIWSIVKGNGLYGGVISTYAHGQWYAKGMFYGSIIT